MRNNQNKIGCFGIFVIVMLFIYVITEVQKNNWLIIPVIFVVAALILLVVAYIRSLRPKEVNAELLKIEAMDGFAFEEYTAKLLRYNGFKNVQVTQASGDYGADVVCFKNDYKYVFQCKCYSSNLGVKAVQEIFSAKQHYNADIAVVLINSFFSPNAKILAEETDVELWDRNRLIELIRFSIKEKNEQKIQKSINTSENVQKISPVIYPSFDESPIMSVDATIVQPPTNNQIQTKELNMATRIGAGKYVFGVNIPLGNYDIRIVSGYGIFELFNLKANHNGAGYHVQEFMNFDNKEGVQSYTNISGKEGDFFTLSSTMVVEITKSNAITIE